MINNSFFRLAGILYSNINIEDSEPSSDRMLLEMIESLLIENQNKAISVSEVYTSIRENFKLTFHDKEIIKVLKSKLDYFNFIGSRDKIEALSRSRKQSIIFNLEKERYMQLNKISKTFDFKNLTLEFWNENKNSFSPTLDFEKVYKLLTNFIYKSFINNLNNFSNIFNENNEKLQDILITNLSGSPYESDEIKIINLFLSYNNPDKNKLIFYIMTLSFEYITAVNNSSPKDKKYILHNQNMFIDTNVFYRALGFNGGDRQEKTLLFLEKCKQIDQPLFIMDITYTELISSINNRFKYLSTDIINSNNNDLQCLYIEEDPEYHYFEEKKKNPDLNPLLFSALKITELKNILNKYNIKECHSDKKIVLDQENYDTIKKYMHEKNRTHKSLSSDLLVMKNIKTWISQNHNHMFFVTTDKLIQKIDKEHLNGYGICLNPSDWLSFTLRYINRTDNDYESFVSFFNLNSYSERKIPIEFISKFLNFIKKAELDNQNKDLLIESLCEQRFNDIINAPEDEQEEMFVSMSNSILEEKLREIEEQKMFFKKTSEDKENEINIIKYNLKEQEKELIFHKKLNKNLELDMENRDKLIDEQNQRISNQDTEIKKINNRMKIKDLKIKLYLFYFIGIFCFISIVFLLFFNNSSKDILNKWSQENPFGVNVLSSIIATIIIAIFFNFLKTKIIETKLKIKDLS